MLNLTSFIKSEDKSLKCFSKEQLHKFRRQEKSNPPVHPCTAWLPQSIRELGTIKIPAMLDIFSQDIIFPQMKTSITPKTPAGWKTAVFPWRLSYQGFNNQMNLYKSISTTAGGKQKHHIWKMLLKILRGGLAGGVPFYSTFSLITSPPLFVLLIPFWGWYQKLQGPPLFYGTVKLIYLKPRHQTRQNFTFSLRFCPSIEVFFPDLPPKQVLSKKESFFYPRNIQ